MKVPSVLGRIGRIIGMVSDITYSKTEDVVRKGMDVSTRTSRTLVDKTDDALAKLETKVAEKQAKVRAEKPKVVVIIKEK